MTYPVAYTNWGAIELPNEGEKAFTFLTPLFRIGTGATAATGVKIGTTAIPLTEIQAVTSLTAGNSIAAQIKVVRLVASQSGYDRGMFINYASEVKSPNVTGMKINVDFGTTGYSHNRAASLCLEMNMPNQAITRGEYSCLELEMVVDASTTLENTITSFIYFGVNGTKGPFNSNGYLFDIQGPTDLAGGFFDDTGANAADAFLKIRVNAKDYWLAISEDVSWS